MLKVVEHSNTLKGFSGFDHDGMAVPAHGLLINYVKKAELLGIFNKPEISLIKRLASI